MKKLRVVTTKRVILAILILLVLLFALFLIFFNVSSIVGDSMLNAYKPGELIIYQRYVKSFTYGDCIIFKRENHNVIKRVVGVPGDNIYIINNALIRNGNIVEENYRIGLMNNMANITVGDDELFVLGDNRTDSIDSREYGCIKSENVVGKVLRIKQEVVFYG